MVTWKLRTASRPLIVTTVPLQRRMATASTTRVWSGSTPSRIPRLCLRLTYRDPLQLFFTYLQLSYLHTQHGYYRDYTYSLDRIVSTPIDSRHHRQTFAVGVIDKSIAPLDEPACLATHSHSSYISSQLHHLYQIQSDLLMPQLTMTCNKLHPSTWPIPSSGSLWMHHPRQLRPIFSLRESLEAGLTLGSHWLFGLEIVHSMNEVGPRSYQHTVFGDLDARWEASKRIKLSARLSNLLGQTSTKSIAYSPPSSPASSSSSFTRACSDLHPPHLRRPLHGFQIEAHHYRGVKLYCFTPLTYTAILMHHPESK